MPSRKKINLQKVLASLYTDCTECQAKIEPAQIQRMGFYEVKCPDWLIDLERLFLQVPPYRERCLAEVPFTT